MDWKKFQEVVAQVFRQVGCVVDEDIRVLGARSGHDIDVLVTFFNHGFKVQWVLECKYWSKNIPKEKVLVLKSIVDDIGADKGFIICGKGFQSGAIEFTKNTNIELVSLDDLKRIISSSVIPVIKFSDSLRSAVMPKANFVGDEILSYLRNPDVNAHPDVYREYLMRNSCQRTQKAAASGLSKIQSTESTLLLVERLGNFWGIGAIKSSINALSKLARHGGILGLSSTLLVDSRLYYEKLEAISKTLKKIGDEESYSIVQSIIENRLPMEMEMEQKLSRQVPDDIEYLMKCGNKDLIHGLVLSAFFNHSIWSEKVKIDENIEKSIEYAEENLPRLISIISEFDISRPPTVIS